MGVERPQKPEIEFVDSFALFPELLITTPFIIRRRLISDLTLPIWLKRETGELIEEGISTIGQLLQRNENSGRLRRIKSIAIRYLKDYEPQIFQQISYTNQLLPELDLTAEFLARIGPESIGDKIHSVRIYNALSRRGFILIGQLLGQTEKRLLTTTSNLGKKGFIILKKALLEYIEKRLTEKDKIIPIREEIAVDQDDIVEIYPGINLPFSELPTVLNYIAAILQERTST